MSIKTTNVFSASFINADNASFDIWVEQITDALDMGIFTVHTAVFTVWVANNETGNMESMSFGRLEGGLDCALEFVQELISEMHLTVVDKPAYKLVLESEGNEDSAEGQLRLERFVSVEYRQKRGTYLVTSYRVVFENAGYINSSEFGTYTEAKERFDGKRDE